jgi:hypothetical protein
VVVFMTIPALSAAQATQSLGRDEESEESFENEWDNLGQGRVVRADLDVLQRGSVPGLEAQTIETDGAVPADLRGRDRAGDRRVERDLAGDGLDSRDLADEVARSLG